MWVLQNRLFVKENPIKMDALGVPAMEASKSLQWFFSLKNGGTPAVIIHETSRFSIRNHPDFGDPPLWKPPSIYRTEAPAAQKMWCGSGALGALARKATHLAAF